MLLRVFVACAVVLLSRSSIVTPDPMAPDPKAPRPIAARQSLFTEELTWMEIRDLMEQGIDTILIASGGVEQNGPYLVTGKHNIVLRATTEAIARKLGNTVIAPIIPFVPEGDFSPPSLHMKYPGSISLSEETFERLVADICTSFHVTGFKHLVLIGDSGGNQSGMQKVAERLNAQWSADVTRVHYIADYFNYPKVTKFVEERGIKEVSEGLHDDFGMSAVMLSIDPHSIRTDERIAAGKFRINGIDLGPVDKTAAWGRQIIDFRASAAVEAIRKSLGR